MNPSDLHERASLLFLELRRLPEQERAAALEAATPGDEPLRAEVSSLLRHDLEDAPDPGSETSTAWPSRIGPYRILARIGSGGSGHVFLAEQEQPIQRRVAIKIVPQAALSEELAARFEVERRAMERTEHPNIARVLDAGRTQDGLPYLVMEYIEGVSISAHCDRRALGLEERIRLMLDVAGAVQHAHQRGVIHRDLKPANILVSEVGGKARPYVLDFGIAKPTEGFPGDLPATSGLPLGTPAYMAPEQTGFCGVDTRADVYALGAVLYELACGKPPIEIGGDPFEVLRRVREELPAPLRRRTASSGPRSVLAASSAALVADLDCVLGKALEKTPERRYPTVEALANDLRRLLASKPIEARPPNLPYRAARFARRNRVLVSSAWIVALALLVGVVGLVHGLLEARRQRISALDESAAQREINRFLTDDLLAAASPDRDGENVTVLELLNRASLRVDERFPGRPLIAASIHHTLGDAYAELGEFDRAEHHLARAIAMRRSAAGTDSPDTVRSEISGASLVARRERYQEARPALEAVLLRARLILGSDDPALYSALNDLGVTLECLGMHERAMVALEEALAGRRRLLGQDASAVLTTLANLATVHDQKGEQELALELLRSALRIAETRPEEGPMAHLGLNNNIGATLQDLGRNEEAVPFLRRAAEIADKVLGARNPATLTIQGNLAGLEADLGAPERAVDLYEKVVACWTEILGPLAEDTLTARHGYWSSVSKAGRRGEAVEGFQELLRDIEASLGAAHWLAAQGRASLAHVLLDEGRPDEAYPLALEALERFRVLFGPDHSRSASASSLIADIRAASGGGE